LALVLTLVLTRLGIWILPKLGMLAYPGGRHIHKEATPKGGGLAIAVAFFAAWAALIFSPWAYFIGSMKVAFLQKVAVPAALLILVGLIDDKFNIRARYKLVLQVVIAVICWYSGIRLTNFLGFELNQVLSLVLTVAWIIGFINAFNLIDGLDGLAAGLTVVASVCMACVLAFQHAPLDTVTILCLGTASLGFLRYNFYPAKIFMGDTGSMFVGFMLAIIGIVGSVKTATFSAVLIPILAAGVPVFDVFLAIWRRLAKRILQGVTKDKVKDSNVMEGDKEHLHHRLLDSSKSQQKTAIAIYSLAIFFGILSLVIMFSEDNKVQALAFLMILGAFVVAIRRLAIVELWNSTKVLVHGVHRPKRTLLLALTHPFSDMLFLIFGFLVAYFLFAELKGGIRIPRDCYVRLTYNVMPIFLLLFVGGIYRRFWLKADAQDYLRLIEILAIGHIVSALISYLVGIKTVKIFMAQHLIFFLLSTGCIVFERMLIRYLKSNLIHNLYMKHFCQKNLSRVLVYGAGAYSKFFLAEKRADIEADPVEIIGIIDDFSPLWKQFVYGYRVLGGVDDLARIHEQFKFDKLILTSRSLQESNRKKAEEFCAEHDIELTELVTLEKKINK